MLVRAVESCAKNDPVKLQELADQTDGELLYFLKRSEIVSAQDLGKSFLTSISMLVSQWKVNSASTSQLMVNFYQALESKKGAQIGKKAKSLQEATLRLMNDGRYRHPFDWAGFVLVGSNN